MDENRSLIPIRENTEEGWSRKPEWYILPKEKTAMKRGADICTFIDWEKKLMVSVTFADLGIAQLHSISCADFARNEAVSVHSIKRPSLKFPKLSDSSLADSSISYFDSQMTASLLKRSEKRYLLVTAPSLVLPSGETGFKADITLCTKTGNDSISSLIRKKDRGFIYTTRFMPLHAEGTLFIGDRIEKLGNGSTAGIAWVRTRGQFSDSILDISALGNEEDGEWGLSLSEANELRNAIIINGKLFKIGKCSISRPEDLMSGIWHAEDESHTLLLDMQPSSILRYKETVKPFKGETCEVYCIFTGSFTMPDGHKFSIRQSYGSVKLASES